MPKTKATEKDRTGTAAVVDVPFGDGDPACGGGPRRRRGVGWNAWPFSWVVPLVSSTRPSGVTVAEPSRVRFAPVKPL